MDKSFTVVVLLANETRFDKALKNIINPLTYSNINWTYATKEMYKDKLSKLIPKDNAIYFDDNLSISASKNKIINAINSDYIHIVEDDLVILNTNIFKQIINMMELLDIGIVVSPTSISNFELNICVPRITTSNIISKKIDNDMNIDWYSYESKDYIVIKNDKTDPCLLFEEKYNYNYLAENIWRRYYTNKSVPFLNFYPMLSNFFSCIIRDKTIDTHITKEIMEIAKHEVEDANIKWIPDNNIDEVLKYIASHIKD